MQPGDEVVIYPRTRLRRHIQLYGNKGVVLRGLPSRNIEVEFPPSRPGDSPHRVWIRPRDLRKISALEKLAEAAD